MDLEVFTIDFHFVDLKCIYVKNQPKKTNDQKTVFRLKTIE